MFEIIGEAPPKARKGMRMKMNLTVETDALSKARHLFFHAMKPSQLSIELRENRINERHYG